MAKAKTKSTEPVVIRGSHSTRTEYPDGRVEFETHWDELKRDVEQALAEYQLTKPATDVKLTKVKKEKTVAKKTTKKVKEAVAEVKPKAKKAKAK